MLTILHDKVEIESAQDLFQQAILKELNKENVAIVGYPGGSKKETFYWSPNLLMWAVFGRGRNRFWNIFGILDKPKLPGLNSIDVEINFPFKGIDRRISGVIAKDGGGNLFIAHRGTIGGGRKGIGKELFLNNYRGEWIDIKDKDNFASVAIIGSLDSSRFVQQILNFVQEVQRIKKLSKKVRKSISVKIRKKFSPEFFGRKNFEMSTKIVSSKCDHGLIVNALAHVLEEKGLKIGNDLFRDLYIFDKLGNLSSIFEVKPDLSLWSIYPGIGQLLFNSIEFSSKIKLILVLPEKPNENILSKLKKIGILCLYYGWVKRKPYFPNLKDII